MVDLLPLREMCAMLRQIGVKFTQDQYDALERKAREKGIISVSTYVRSVLVETLFLPTNGSKTTEEVDMKPKVRDDSEAD